MMTSTISASVFSSQLSCVRRSITTALPTPCSSPKAHRLTHRALQSPAWLPTRSTGSSRLIAMAQVPALTQIPNSKTNEEAVVGLLQLAHDCSAAYGTAAEKANDAELKQALQKFAKQADSHIDQWRGLLSPPPDKETTISTSINANKVKLANLGGDKAIVAAIFNNSNDSSTAYEGISKRSEFPKQTTSLAAKLLPEAQEQRTFLEKYIKQ